MYEKSGAKQSNVTTFFDFIVHAALRRLQQYYTREFTFGNRFPLSDTIYLVLCCSNKKKKNESRSTVI